MYLHRLYFLYYCVCSNFVFFSRNVFFQKRWMNNVLYGKSIFCFFFLLTSWCILGLVVHENKSLCFMNEFIQVSTGSFKYPGTLHRFQSKWRCLSHRQNKRSQRSTIFWANLNSQLAVNWKHLLHKNTLIKNAHLNFLNSISFVN